MRKKANNRNEQRLAENMYTKHISFLPVILMLAIVPLIVRFSVIPLDPAVSVFWTSKIETDTYCFSKSIMIMSLSVVMLVSLFFMVDKYNLKIDRITKLIFGAIGLFLMVSILSTVTSEYGDVAMWGAPERHEGLVMYLCYMIMFLYTYFIIRDSYDFKYIKYALLFLSFVMVIIGLSQVMNKDILASNFIYNFYSVKAGR